MSHPWPIQGLSKEGYLAIIRRWSTSKLKQTLRNPRTTVKAAKGLLYAELLRRKHA